MAKVSTTTKVLFGDQAYRTKEEAINAYFKLMDTHTILISRNVSDLPYLVTYKVRVPEYLRTNLWKSFNEVDKLQKPITNKKLNTPVFNKFKDAYLKWLASDISIEKSRKEQFWNNNVMDITQKKIWETKLQQNKILRKIVDDLTLQLKTFGYNTEQMERDIAFLNKLKAETTYIR